MRRHILRFCLLLGVLMLPQFASGMSMATQEPIVLDKRSVIISSDASSTPLTLKLEMADTPQQQRVGLMHRKNLSDDDGMVFNFNSCERRTMWMKDTLVALDMLFIDCKGKIGAIVEHTTPLSEKHISPDLDAAAVIELPAGNAKKLGIKVGDTVMIQQGLQM